MTVGGGDRIHPGKARKSGWHGPQKLAPCLGQQILRDVHEAVLSLVVRQKKRIFLALSEYIGARFSLSVLKPGRQYTLNVHVRLNVSCDLPNITRA